MIVLAGLSIIIAYLLGSISFAVIFSKLFSHVDVRKQGSGNAGTTNVLRVSGVKAGVLTLLCDALKGVVACLIGVYAFKYAFDGSSLMILYGKYLCGFACMVGHAYPIFFGFAGGKCAATSVGVFAICCPLGIAFGVGGWLLTLLVTKIVSISSLIATVIVATSSIVINGLNDGVNYVIIVVTAFMAAVVILRHKDNIKRLINKQEKKLKVKK